MPTSRLVDVLIAMFAVLVAVGMMLQNMHARTQYFNTLPPKPDASTRQVMMSKLNQYARALEETYRQNERSENSPNQTRSELQPFAGLHASEMQFVRAYAKFLPDSDDNGFGTITDLRVKPKIYNAISMPVQTFPQSRYLVVAGVTTSWQGHYDDATLSSSMTDTCTFIIQAPTHGTPLLPEIQAFSLFDYSIIEMQQSQEFARRANWPWWMDLLYPMKL